jgi:hypothetical protein
MLINQGKQYIVRKKTFRGFLGENDMFFIVFLCRYSIMCIKMRRMAINPRKTQTKLRSYTKRKVNFEGTGMKNRLKEMVSS